MHDKSICQKFLLHSPQLEFFGLVDIIKKKDETFCIWINIGGQINEDTFCPQLLYCFLLSLQLLNFTAFLNVGEQNCEKY